MNTVLLVFAMLFAATIMVESLEFDDFQLGDDSDSMESIQFEHRLRKKRDSKQHICGQRLNKMVAEVCSSCSRNPNTSAIGKRKRDIDSAFLEQKIRTKREEGIATHCCKKGCTMAELKGYCC